MNLIIWAPYTSLHELILHPFDKFCDLLMHELTVNITAFKHRTCVNGNSQADEKGFKSQPVNSLIRKSGTNLEVRLICNPMSNKTMTNCLPLVLFIFVWWTLIVVNVGAAPLC